MPILLKVASLVIAGNVNMLDTLVYVRVYQLPRLYRHVHTNGLLANTVGSMRQWWHESRNFRALPSYQ